MTNGPPCRGALLRTAEAANAWPADRSAQAPQLDIAYTKQGAVRGVIEGNTVAFKALPYARPPVGSLRWRPSEPLGPWQGVRDGSRFGAICPQIVGKEVAGGEDCLSLNIWRPRYVPQRRLPVMVYLTGGGNHAYSGEGTPQFGGVNYNGEKLVPEGVVFVSFNFRLGVLAFLAHPALDAERPEKISGKLRRPRSDRHAVLA